MRNYYLKRKHDYYKHVQRFLHFESNERFYERCKKEMSWLKISSLDKRK